MVRKQQCLVVPSPVQNVDDFDEVRSDPIEDQIVRVNAPADAVIVRPDVASNSDEIALCRSRNDDFHPGAQSFPARR